MRSIIVLGITLMLAGCTGGGDTVISGLGNSGNRIRTDAVVDDVVRALVQHSATPEVSDDDLMRSYQAIRSHALEGELQASLVLLQLAAQQREADE